MSKLILVGILSFLFVEGFSQSTIKGKVMDAMSGEMLNQALIKTNGNVVTSDKNGNFTLQLPKGEYELVASLDGYNNDTIAINANRNLILDVVFKLENQNASMQAIQITASMAKDRKTPIAYSNITSKDIQEKLGSSDLPMLLNNTPGVYATQQGGGAGDARITIRGFNQRNIAVMIDGIPVNDMENGWVYWSNWFGLGPVTALTQVQRGLGSSRIANPAVGGTMNIITKGITSQQKLSANVEIGDSRYTQFGFDFASGKLKGDWGFLLAATKRSSNGYVDYLFDDMYSYFAKIEKQWGSKHSLSLTVMGAPQAHGQRTYKARLSLYDRSMAMKLGMDTVLTNMAVNQGIKYNQHWGALNEAKIDNNTGDTLWGQNKILNERVNMFHKPQVYLKYDFKPNKKVLSSTVVYMSTGSGGGTAKERVNQVPFNYGTMDFQSVWFQNNDYGFVSAIDYKYSPTERKSAGILYRSVNNHTWYGLLNTTQYKFHKFFTFSGGVDLRSYVGQHYKEVYDLIGGDYFIPDVNELNPGYDKLHKYKQGDIFNYHNDGLVNWAGTFGELEYSRGRTSAFINASYSNSFYKRKDYFRLDSNGNPAETEWISRSGYTLKTGVNYNVNKNFNIFTNIGYLNRPTRYSNIFDNKNRVIQGAENELVYAFEGGAAYKSKSVSINLNGYYTNWVNRPVDFLPSFPDVDGNMLYFNINGLRARHMGIELQSVFKPGSGITIEFGMALGDWIWKSGSNAIVRDDAGDSVGMVKFNADRVHVGDAAQVQYTAMIRWEPTELKGSYISLQYVRFEKQFADFQPTALTGAFAGKESFKLPDYWYMNLNLGYKITLPNQLNLNIYGMINNITNNIYISDAQHRSLGANDNPAPIFNPKNLEVFLSQGLRYTTGIRLTF